MRSFFVLNLAAALLLQTTAKRPGPPVAGANQDILLFTISEAERGRLVLDAFAQIASGKLASVPQGCFENDIQYKQFAAKYLQAGASYNVTFRGNSAGRAIIQQRSPVWEDGAVVRYDGPILVSGDTMTLASNRAEVGRGINLSRSAEPAEQSLVLQLAKLEFTKAGLPQRLLADVSVDHLEIDSFGAGKNPISIGTFSVDDTTQKGVTHSLLLVAELKGKKAMPQFVSAHISSGLTDNQEQAFVDFGDVLGDGQQEIVIRVRYYKDYRYQVLRRVKKNHPWEKIFQTDLLGCE
jgi:hypothetical protein